MSKRMNRHIALYLALSVGFSVNGISTYANDTKTFSDTDSHWASSSIELLNQAGILSGYADGTFRPNNNITRAELASCLQNIFELNSNNASNFDDIDSNDWYADAVAAVSDIMNYDGNYFRPSDFATREEVAFAIAHANGMNSSTVKDLKDTAQLFDDGYSVSDWSKESMDILVTQGYLSGRPDGTLDPQGNITRGELANMLERIITSDIYKNDLEKDFTIVQQEYKDNKHQVVSNNIAMPMQINTIATPFETATITPKIHVHPDDGNDDRADNLIDGKEIWDDPYDTVWFDYPAFENAVDGANYRFQVVSTDNTTVGGIAVESGEILFEQAAQANGGSAYWHHRDTRNLEIFRKDGLLPTPNQDGSLVYSGSDLYTDGTLPFLRDINDKYLVDGTVEIRIVELTEDNQVLSISAPQSLTYEYTIPEHNQPYTTISNFVSIDGTFIPTTAPERAVIRYIPEMIAGDEEDLFVPYKDAINAVKSELEKQVSDITISYDGTSVQLGEDGKLSITGTGNNGVVTPSDIAKKIKETLGTKITAIEGQLSEINKVDVGDMEAYVLVNDNFDVHIMIFWQNWNDSGKGGSTGLLVNIEPTVTKEVSATVSNDGSINLSVAEGKTYQYAIADATAKVGDTVTFNTVTDGKISYNEIKQQAGEKLLIIRETNATQSIATDTISEQDQIVPMVVAGLSYEIDMEEQEMYVTVDGGAQHGEVLTGLSVKYTNDYTDSFDWSSITNADLASSPNNGNISDNLIATPKELTKAIGIIDLSQITKDAGKKFAISADFSGVIVDDKLFVKPDPALLEVVKDFEEAPEPTLTSNGDGTATLSIPKASWDKHKDTSSIKLRAAYAQNPNAIMLMSLPKTIDLTERINKAAAVDGNYEIIITRDDINGIKFSSFDNSIEVVVSSSDYFVTNDSSDSIAVPTVNDTTYTTKLTGESLDAVSVSVSPVITNDNYKINVLRKNEDNTATINSAEYTQVATTSKLTQVVDLSEWDFAVGDIVEVTIINLSKPTIETSIPTTSVTIEEAPEFSTPPVEYNLDSNTLKATLHSHVDSNEKEVDITYSVNYKGGAHIENEVLGTVAHGTATATSSEQTNGLKRLSNGDIMTLTSSQKVWNILPNESNEITPTPAPTVTFDAGLNTEDNLLSFNVTAPDATQGAYSDYTAKAYILKANGTKEFSTAKISISNSGNIQLNLSTDLTSESGTLQVENGDQVGIELSHKTNGLIYNTSCEATVTVEETKNIIAWADTDKANEIKFTVVNGWVPENDDDPDNIILAHFDKALQLGFNITDTDGATTTIPLTIGSGVTIASDGTTATTAVITVDLDRVDNSSISELKDMIVEGNSVAVYVDHISSLQTPNVIDDPKEIKQIATPEINIAIDKAITEHPQGNLTVTLVENIAKIATNAKSGNPSNGILTAIVTLDGTTDAIAKFDLLTDNNSYILATNSPAWESATDGNISVVVTSNQWYELDSNSSTSLEITKIPDLIVEENNNGGFTVTLEADNIADYINTYDGSLKNNYQFSIRSLHDETYSALTQLMSSDKSLHGWIIDGNTATLNVTSADLKAQMGEDIASTLTWDTEWNTAITKDSSCQVMQLNYNRGVTFDEIKLDISQISNGVTESPPIYSQTGTNLTPTGEGYFQWAYRNNTDILPAGSVVEIKITGKISDSENIITKKYTVTEEDVKAATGVEPELKQDKATSDFNPKEAFNNTIEFKLENIINWLEKSSIATDLIEKLSSYVPKPVFQAEPSDAENVYVEIPHSYDTAATAFDKNLSITLYKQTSEGVAVDTEQGATGINSVAGLAVVIEGAADPEVTINQSSIENTTTVVQIPVSLLSLVEEEDGCKILVTVSHANPNIPTQTVEQTLSLANETKLTEDVVDGKIEVNVENWDDATVRKVEYTKNTDSADEILEQFDSNKGYIELTKSSFVVDDKLEVKTYGKTWNVIPNVDSRTIVTAPTPTITNVSEDGIMTVTLDATELGVWTEKADYSDLTATMSITSGSATAVTINNFTGTTVDSTTTVAGTSSDLDDTAGWTAAVTGDIQGVISSSKWYVLDNGPVDALETITQIPTPDLAFTEEGITVQIDNTDNKYVTPTLSEPTTGHLKAGYELKFNSLYVPALMSINLMSAAPPREWTIIGSTASTLITNEEIRQKGIEDGHNKIKVELINNTSWLEKDNSSTVDINENFVPKAVFATEPNADYVVINIDGAWKNNSFDADYTIDLFVEATGENIADETGNLRLAHSDIAKYITGTGTTATLKIPVKNFKFINETETAELAGDIDKVVKARVTHKPTTKTSITESGTLSSTTTASFSGNKIPKTDNEITKNKVEVIIENDWVDETVTYTKTSDDIVSSPTTLTEDETNLNKAYIDLEELDLAIGDTITIDVKAADWRKLPTQTISKSVQQAEKPIISINKDSNVMTITAVEDATLPFDSNTKATAKLFDASNTVIDTQTFEYTDNKLELNLSDIATAPETNLWTTATSGNINVQISDSRWHIIDSRQTASEQIKNVATITTEPATDPTTGEGLGIKVTINSTEQDYLDGDKTLKDIYKIAVEDTYQPLINLMSMRVKPDYGKLKWDIVNGKPVALITNEMLVADGIGIDINDNAIKVTLDHGSNWFQKPTSDTTFMSEITQLAPKAIFVQDLSQLPAGVLTVEADKTYADYMVIEIPNFTANLTVILSKVTDSAVKPPVYASPTWDKEKQVQLITNGIDNNSLGLTTSELNGSKYLVIPKENLQLSPSVDLRQKMMVEIKHKNPNIQSSITEQKLQLAPKAAINGTKNIENKIDIYSQMTVSLSQPMNGELEVPENWDGLKVSYEVKSPTSNIVSNEIPNDTTKIELKNLTVNQTVQIDVESKENWFVLPTSTISPTTKPIEIIANKDPDSDGIFVTVTNLNESEIDNLIGVYQSIESVDNAKIILDEHLQYLSNNLADYKTIGFKNSAGMIQALITEEDLKSLDIKGKMLKIVVSHKEDWLMIDGETEIELPEQLAMAKPIATLNGDNVRIEIPNATLDGNKINNLIVGFTGNNNSILTTTVWEDIDGKIVTDIPITELSNIFENKGGTIDVTVKHVSAEEVLPGKISIIIPPAPQTVVFKDDKIEISILLDAIPVGWKAEYGVLGDSIAEQTIESSSFTAGTGEDVDKKIASSETPLVSAGNIVTVTLKSIESDGSDGNDENALAVPISIEADPAISAPSLDVKFSQTEMTVKVNTAEINEKAMVQYNEDNTNTIWAEFTDGKVEEGENTKFVKAISTMQPNGISKANLRVVPINSTAPFAHPIDTDLINDSDIVIEEVTFAPTQSPVMAMSTFIDHTITVKLTGEVNPSEIKLDCIISGVPRNDITFTPVGSDEKTDTFVAQLEEIDIPEGKNIAITLKTADNSTTYYTTNTKETEETVGIPAPKVDYLMAFNDSGVLFTTLVDCGKVADSGVETYTIWYKINDEDNETQITNKIIDHRYRFDVPSDKLESGDKLTIIVRANENNVIKESSVTHTKLEQPVISFEKGTVTVNKGTGLASYMLKHVAPSSSPTPDNNDSLSVNKTLMYRNPITFKKLPDFENGNNLNMILYVDQDGYIPNFTSKEITPSDVTLTQPSVTLTGNIVTIDQYGEYLNNGAEVYIAIQDTEFVDDDGHIIGTVEENAPNELLAGTIYKYDSSAGYILPEVDADDTDGANIQILVKHDNYKVNHITNTRTYTNSEIGELRVPDFIGVENERLIVRLPDPRTDKIYYHVAKKGIEVLPSDITILNNEITFTTDNVDYEIAISAIQDKYPDLTPETATNYVIHVITADDSTPANYSKIKEYEFKETDFPIPVEITSLEIWGHWVGMELNKMPDNSNLYYSTTEFGGSTVPNDTEFIEIDSDWIETDIFTLMAGLSIADTDASREQLIGEVGIYFAIADNTTNEIIATAKLTLSRINVEVAIPTVSKISRGNVCFVSDTLDDMGALAEIQYRTAGGNWTTMNHSRSLGYHVSESTLSTSSFEARTLVYAYYADGNEQQTYTSGILTQDEILQDNPELATELLPNNPVTISLPIIDESFDLSFKEELLPELELAPTPEIRVPEVEVPEIEVPEVEVPEAETPEVEVPEVEVPEVEMPEIEVPEVEVPEVEVPEIEEEIIEEVEIEEVAPEIEEEIIEEVDIEEVAPEIEEEIIEEVEIEEVAPEIEEEIIEEVEIEEVAPEVEEEIIEEIEIEEIVAKDSKNVIAKLFKKIFRI
ncbi:hypothetical protein AN641_08195 [Candidatus Epulonipiscioides gigas]|nr:hypothetical protein AN641_08195 [Epulopiscium sp. SCG-C07WGA-EpuloA2]